MEIIEASVYGFCKGVERSLIIAQSALEEAKRRNIPLYLYGEIVHNEKVNEKLIEKGALFFSSNTKPPGIVVIRAHGIEEEERDRIEKEGFILYDAVCPIVKRGAELLRNAKNPVIVGNEKHAEIIMLSSVRKDAPIISNPAEEIEGERECVFQSTISDEFYESFKKRKNLKLLNSPCAASVERRRAVKDIVDRIDALVVVGSQNSANARALCFIAEERGKKAFLVSSFIPDEIFDYNTIGLTASASTEKEEFLRVKKEIEKKLV